MTPTSPVRPPAFTPAALSIKDVTGEVPSAAPAITDSESASSTLRSLGRVPSGLSSPAWLATPTRVPVESNRSTKKKARMTDTAPSRKLPPT